MPLQQKMRDEISTKYYKKLEQEVKDMKEGHSPHAKGTKKYKAHMAAKHASMAEGVKRNAIYQQVGKMLAKGHSMDAIKKRYNDLDKANPGYLEKIAQALKDRNEIPYDKYKSIKGAVESKVTLEDMRNALNLNESTDSNTVVASYVRTMLNEKHNTWNKVTKEIDFVINLKSLFSINPKDLINAFEPNSESLSDKVSKLSSFLILIFSTCIIPPVSTFFSI